MDNSFGLWISDMMVLGPVSGPAVLLSMVFVILTFMYSIFYFIRWILAYKVYEEFHFILIIGCIPYVNLGGICICFYMFINAYIFNPIFNKLENIRIHNVKKRENKNERI